MVCSPFRDVSREQQGGAHDSMPDDRSNFRDRVRKLDAGRLELSPCLLGRQLPTCPYPNEGERNAGRDPILRYVRI